MKKALTTIVVLSGIAAAVAYKLKKDEEKKIMKLEKELLEEESLESEETCECSDTCECDETEECQCETEEACNCDESCSCEENCDTEESCGCLEEENVLSDEVEIDETKLEYPFLNSDAYKTIEEMNNEIISELDADGDVHSNERPIQHTVEFKTFDDLEEFKKTVISRGFVVTKGESELELFVLHIAPIDRLKLVESIYYLANQTLAHHGIYKGWRSRVSY